MFVKKFEGETLDEALQSVKRELGPDAIILKTVTNKGLKGAFKKNRIEITAAISENNYSRKAKVDHVLTDDQRDTFYKAPASRVNSMINDYNGHQVSDAPKVQSSYGNMGLNKVVNTVTKASNRLKNSLDDFLSMEEESPRDDKLDGFLNSKNAKKVEKIEEEVDLRDTNSYGRYSSSHDEEDEIDHTEELIHREREHYDEVSFEIKQEVKNQRHHIELLEKKLFELTDKLSNRKDSDEEPTAIRGLRTTLRSLDLNEKIVQNIIKKSIFELTKNDLNDPDIIYDFALRELNSMIRVSMPLFSAVDTEQTPVVTALISENSCGQRSMAMKLAVIQENVKIISFRESEVEEINSDFTSKIFKIDFTSVHTLAHLMSEARKALADGKSLILDLRLSFKDNNESKKFIDTLKRSFEKLEILITISGIHSEMYNSKILSKYNSYSNGVIISYMDQCLSFGSLLNLHNEFQKLDLKFFGTGATVPDDLEAATAERILAGMFEL